jgi:hypothetical protein
MIKVNSKSTALVREHHLACRLSGLDCQLYIAAGEFYSAIIKKQNVLKKKILTATFEQDQESIDHYSAQYEQLESCNSNLTMELIKSEILALKK